MDDPLWIWAKIKAVALVSVGLVAQRSNVFHWLQFCLNIMTCLCFGVWYTSHAESVSWDHLLQLFTFVPVVKLRNTRPIQMLTQEAFCRHHMLSCIWFGVMLHLSVLSWLRPCRLSTSLSMVVQKHKITDSVHKRLSRNLSMATQCANATLTRVAL